MDSTSGQGVLLGGPGDLVSRLESRDIIRVTPFRVLRTLTKSPGPPSILRIANKENTGKKALGLRVRGLRVEGLGFRV